jgi:hypothetical protein
MPGWVGPSCPGKGCGTSCIVSKHLCRAHVCSISLACALCAILLLFIDSAACSSKGGPVLSWVASLSFQLDRGLS